MMKTTTPILTKIGGVNVLLTLYSYSTVLQFNVYVDSLLAMNVLVHE